MKIVKLVTNLVTQNKNPKSMETMKIADARIRDAPFESIGTFGIAHAKTKPNMATNQKENRHISAADTTLETILDQIIPHSKLRIKCEGLRSTVLPEVRPHMI